MKKLLPSVILLLAFASCKPKQTCLCTYTDGTGAHSIKNEIIGSSKGQAKQQCETFKGYLGSQGYKSVSCAIQ